MEGEGDTEERRGRATRRRGEEEDNGEGVREKGARGEMKTLMLDGWVGDAK